MAGAGAAEAGVTAGIGVGRGATGTGATRRGGCVRRCRRLEYGRTVDSEAVAAGVVAAGEASCAHASDPPAVEQSASMAAIKAAASETRDVNDVPWVKRKLLGFV
jgi:hypothetical protein